MGVSFFQLGYAPMMKSPAFWSALLAFVFLLAMSQPIAAQDGAAHAELQQKIAEMGPTLPLITVLPFVLLLLCIAVLPLYAAHWWESNVHKAYVVVGLSAPLMAYLVAMHWAGGHVLVEQLREYISFMILLAALYVISGGIYVRGSLNGTPLANTALLGLGAIVASFIGTTGASVLLIRPLLRANKTRQNVAHIVVFFIFVVSNCGGLLTPLGDPPLFMGFLKGVPFEWTIVNLWQQWLLVNVLLLVIFNVWDQIVFAREEKERPGSQLEEVMKHEPIGVSGGLNFLFLLGVVATIYCSGNVKLPGNQPWPWGMQQGIMAGLAIAAYLTTANENRAQNKFTFGPIIEVAVLFIGIFITMAPALLILNAWGQPEGGREILGVKFGMREPWQFFWVSGALSSFLDNAPTYMTMAATACGLNGVAAEGSDYLKTFLAQGPTAVRLLKAISCGAVFMGANTYIGNGPNFMVKAIAEENNVRMPSFFGYMLYSCGVLIPIFVLVTFVFFRG
ncbi:sodium:proton antiporter [Anatilimnocola floriformis]|uniref:sodium:proton antiporter n=1 Tax=Anatilimnocola floriformis TaxID=2948575 RepID=UPI0020C2D562|nr:sodium:proton antiporter [Anatilimnocola floriformis]